MARGYFASRLSEGRAETPEGFLVIPDCVIARTGFQTYSCADLPQESARDLGVDLSNPRASIDLYRRAQDVFAPATLASFEGKPLTDQHPDEFVNPDNFKRYACGHIQNVRKGSEPLESGEWPLLADVIVTAEPLLSKVKNKLVEELSCGYDYAIVKDGAKICQTDITGNHTAVVPRGRAGSEARINDSAPPEPAIMSPGSGDGHAVSITNATLTNKEKHKVKNNLLHLLGLGLRAKAADADTDPEELAQAALDVGKFQSEEPVEDRKPAKDRKVRDAEVIVEEDEPVVDRKPAKARDKRSRMHDALDKMLDEEEAEPVQATDADLEELKKLLAQFFSEEETEPQHKVVDLEEDPEIIEDADPSELDEVLGCQDEVIVEEEEADDEDEDEESEDEEEAPGEVIEPSGEEVLEAKAADRARAADGAAAVLKMLRPIVARSNDSAVRNAFNTALGSVKRSSRANTGSYGAFAGAAKARDTKASTNNRARTGDAAPDAIAKMQAYYDNALKGGK